MMGSDHVLLDGDVLQMKLQSVADLLLQRKCETGKDVSYLEVEGREGVLTVILSSNGFGDMHE